MKECDFSPDNYGFTVKGKDPAVVSAFRIDFDQTMKEEKPYIPTMFAGDVYRYLCHDSTSMISWNLLDRDKAIAAIERIVGISDSEIDRIHNQYKSLVAETRESLEQRIVTLEKERSEINQFLLEQNAELITANGNTEYARNAAMELYTRITEKADAMQIAEPTEEEKNQYDELLNQYEVLQKQYDDCSKIENEINSYNNDGNKELLKIRSTLESVNQRILKQNKIVKDVDECIHEIKENKAKLGQILLQCQQASQQTIHPDKSCESPAYRQIKAFFEIYDGYFTALNPNFAHEATVNLLKAIERKGKDCPEFKEFEIMTTRLDSIYNRLITDRNYAASFIEGKFNTAMIPTMQLVIDDCNPKIARHEQFISVIDAAKTAVTQALQSTADVKSEASANRPLSTTAMLSRVLGPIETNRDLVAARMHQESDSTRPKTVAQDKQNAPLENTATHYAAPLVETKDQPEPEPPQTTPNLRQ